MLTALGAVGQRLIIGTSTVASALPHMSIEVRSRVAGGFLSRGRADSAGARCIMTRGTGTFQKFKEHTLAIVRGEREVGQDAPKIWRE
jgi:hypothetical protein